MKNVQTNVNHKPGNSDFSFIHYAAFWSTLQERNHKKQKPNSKVQNSWVTIKHVVSSTSCISFHEGSGKTWKVKNVKDRRLQFLVNKFLAAAFLSTNIHVAKFWPIFVEVTRLSFVGGNRERWQTVTRKRGKASQIFACILLTSNHMIFLVQLGISQHS